MNKVRYYFVTFFPIFTPFLTSNLHTFLSFQKAFSLIFLPNSPITIPITSFLKTLSLKRWLSSLTQTLRISLLHLMVFSVTSSSSISVSSSSSHLMFSASSLSFLLSSSPQPSFPFSLFLQILNSLTPN